jgi:hypothetical protein
MRAMPTKWISLFRYVAFVSCATFGFATGLPGGAEARAPTAAAPACVRVDVPGIRGFNYNPASSRG